jgi:hypothetical protein
VVVVGVVVVREVVLVGGFPFPSPFEIAAAITITANAAATTSGRRIDVTQSR